mgnify:CR=1 FL=1
MIGTGSVEILKSRIKNSKKIFCSGLYLSARWFVLSEVASEGFHLVILPDSESAEYCAADLYGMIEGDRVFFLPSSGSKMERSNYKSSLNVQRTAALEKIVNYDGKSLLIVVTYPDSLSENVPDLESAGKRNLKISEGQEISHAGIVKRLVEAGFEKVDFVSSPGQFAVRGSIIDIFSFSFNNPYRVSFWGNEVEKINIFDCNTQLSSDRLESVEIVSEEMSSSGSESLFSFIPRDSVIWLDSSDTYRECGFFRQTEAFRNVFTDRPLSEENVSTIDFSIAPQPVFNKNFELLSADIRQKAESSYKVFIYGEKQSQLDRLKAILIEENCPLPQFVCGHNIHSGFIDNEDRICCYTDHEIFDRFHRVSIRRSVEKSEQLTVNDLNAFNIGDYVVHIDHGVGIFGGLVRMRDDKGRFHEVVKLTYRDGDVVFVSVHSLHKISKFRSKDGEMPKINKLGSKSWEVLKTRAKSRVKDIAKELINLYAKRRSVQGYAFSADSYLQDELESSFMYEDTPDQEETTRAVKSDMEDKCPMDRLVCGDVGFGKTEIAVRAAFKAGCSPGTDHYPGPPALRNIQVKTEGFSLQHRLCQPASQSEAVVRYQTETCGR